MSVLKSIEIIAQSKDGWEEAAQTAVREASKTVKNIKSVYIREFKADVENGEITNYVVDSKISFFVNH